MKQRHQPLLIAAAILIGLPLSPANADDNTNPWSPSYQPPANRPVPQQPPAYARHPVPPQQAQPRGHVNPWQPRPPIRQAPDWRAFNQRPPAGGQRFNNPPPRPPVTAPQHRPQQARPPQPPVNPAQNRRPGPPPGWRPYNGPSAFNTPGYNPYHDRWSNNRFWGRSGPNSWMHPNKRNFSNGWDDMLNAPSRMGEMPGGWTAPSVSMPNPVDVSDQFEENARDLPDQMRNMNSGD